MTPANTPPRRVRLAQRTGFAAWAGLLLLVLWWHGFALPAPGNPWPALCLAVVPLALPLLTWRRPARALLLAAMVALFYFAHGVVEVWAVAAARGLAIVEIVLSLILIGSIGAAVQKRKK
ncbi:MAG TPA: DUF2069 domain-containing protein [Rhodanobacteraceae bacterium]|nr:DUF2069 domain-containing protein [Rhodanobacteraceae bacterium]